LALFHRIPGNLISQLQHISQTLFFGITPFILNNRYPNIKEMIKTNGIDKMVLESDSPFIPCRPNQLLNPYVINLVAAEISEMIQIPIANVRSDL
jgi:Tat protein secretion system quality control protein TatD with DNase activity